MIFNTVICIEIVALDYPYTCILGKREEKSTSRPKSGKNTIWNRSRDEKNKESDIIKSLKRVISGN